VAHTLSAVALVSSVRGLSRHIRAFSGSTCALRRILTGLFLFGLLWSPGPALGGEPLRIGGQRPTKGVVVLGSSFLGASEFSASPMLRELSGICGELDARAIIAIERETEPIELSGFEPAVARLVLTRRAGEEHERFVVELGNNALALVDPDDGTRGVRVPLETLERHGIDTATMLGAQRQDPRRVEVPHRFNGRIVRSTTDLTDPRQRARFWRRSAGPTSTLSPDDLTLVAPETGFSESLSGVLVWVSPFPSGRVPEPVVEAARAFNLLIVGIDHTGDALDDADRVQRVLDALASVRRAYRVDASRVYAGGFGGGAEIAAVCVLAFPDVFTGALCVGGIGSHASTPTGEPGLEWDKDIEDPDSARRRLVKQCVIGAICGSVDFALPEVRAHAARLRRDGLDVRLDVVEGLAHAVPSASSLGPLLTWVDAQAREHSDTQKRYAERALREIRDALHIRGVSHPKTREALVEVTTLAPWSAPAWDAAEMLGFDREE